MCTPLQRVAQNAPSRIALSNPADVAYWTTSLGLSLNALSMVLQVAGTDARQVRAYVARARGRRCSTVRLPPDPGSSAAG